MRVIIDTEIALTRFDEGGPDLGIRHGPGHWPGLTALPLMDDTLFPVASPTYPGLEGFSVAADIARLPLISDLARQGWHDWFRAAGVHGAALDERCRFSDTTDALEAAATGSARHWRGNGRGAVARRRPPDAIARPRAAGALGLLRDLSRAPAAAPGRARFRRLAVVGAEG